MLGTNKLIKPRISIICVVLNVAEYITETIENISSQTYKFWELIIIDGNSNDGTQNIVKKYCEKDSRIKFISESDEGPWDATEKGVSFSSGEFILIIGGQDGFLDKSWLEKCIKIFDSDPDISLVWGSACRMTEDGKLWPEDVNYSHLINREGKIDALKYITNKLSKIIKSFLFEDWMRKKILVKKFFSGTALFKFNFFLNRSFSKGAPPQKEDWFRYWLDTGLPFADSAMCIVKKVYLDCVKRYPRGSYIRMDHFMDLFYNFNAKGYLAFYIPTLATFGRVHPGNSGDSIPLELLRVENIYLKKVLSLRKRILGGHDEMVFIDRNKNEISRRKF